MITLFFEPERLRAEGHAADAAGCAAVSALLYALAGGLENTGGTRWEIRSGSAEIAIPDRPDAQNMYFMAEVGLRQVAAVRDDIRIAEAGTTGS